MTRAQGSDSELEYRSFGTPGAKRTVVVLRTGAIATTDPGASVTASRDVQIVAAQLDLAELDDPPAFVGESAAESTVAALAILARREAGGAPIGVIGERAASGVALLLAAAAPGVDRLALVAPAAPTDRLAADRVTQTLSTIHGEVLIAARADNDASKASANWYRERLRSAEVSLFPAPYNDPNGGWGLVDVWPEVLAHVAPASRP